MLSPGSPPLIPREALSLRPRRPASISRSHRPGSWELTCVSKSSPLSLPCCGAGMWNTLWEGSSQERWGLARAGSGEGGCCWPGPSAVHPRQPLIPQGLAWPPAQLPHPLLMGTDKGSAGRHGHLTLSSAWACLYAQRAGVCLPWSPPALRPSPCTSVPIFYSFCPSNPSEQHLHNVT